MDNAPCKLYDPWYYNFGLRVPQFVTIYINCGHYGLATPWKRATGAQPNRPMR